MKIKKKILQETFKINSSLCSLGQKLEKKTSTGIGAGFLIYFLFLGKIGLFPEI